MNPFIPLKPSRSTSRILRLGIILSVLFNLSALAAVICDGNPVPASVSPSQFTIAESGGVSGQFNFELPSPVGNSVHLGLQISGTAQNGVDFQTLAGTVTIFGGRTNATLILKPLPDELTEGIETVTLTLTNSDNACVYIGLQNSATISIVDGATVPLDALDLWDGRVSGRTNDLFAAAYGLDLYLAVGDAGTILTSPDAVTWTRRTSVIPAAFNSAVFANGVVAVVGASGTILTSTNGTNWTKRPTGTTDFLYDVAYGNGMFIAVSDTRTIITSTNGITWNRRSNGPQNVFGLAYGNKKFVAVGGVQDCSQLFCVNHCITSSSSDALIWTPSNPALNVELSDIAFGTGLFVAVGEAGTILTSTNGVDWTLRRLTLPQLFNVAYGNGSFIAVGDAGSILQSRYIGPPVLAAPTVQPNGNIELPVFGRIQQNYRLQSTPSLNPVNWTDVANFLQSDPTNSVTDVGGANFSSRFYRVIPAP